MFAAIRRFFKAIGYMLTGRIDDATKGLNEDPNVVRARYDELIDKKRQSIQQVRNAVAGFIRNLERKKAELKSTHDEIAKTERLMNGAKAMATKVAKGKSREEAQQDPEFVKCMSAYKDFKNSLTLLLQRQESLELDVEQSEKEANGYELQLQTLHREIKDLSDEKERSVADVAMARETRAANEAMAGIAVDGTADDLSRLRNTVDQAKAEAKVTARLAGTENVRQESEFLEMAGSLEADSEFMDGIFGGEETAAAEPAQTATQAEKEKLPE